MHNAHAITLAGSEQIPPMKLGASRIVMKQIGANSANLFRKCCSAHQLSQISPHLRDRKTRKPALSLTPSVLSTNTTTIASNSSSNAISSSLSSLANGLAFFNLLLGEVTLGNSGSGFYGITVLVVLTTLPRRTDSPLLRSAAPALEHLLLLSGRIFWPVPLLP